MTNTIKYVVADVRTYEDERSEHKTILIPHCCNNLGIMGSGVALALRNMWEEVFDNYRAMSLELGEVDIEAVEYDELTDEGTKFVANMIGQDGVVGAGNNKPVRYAALLDAMREILKRTEDFGTENVIIHMPMFGSKLAGGNFELIMEMVKEIWLPHMDVTVCVIDESELPLWARSELEE